MSWDRSSTRSGNGITPSTVTQLTPGTSTTGIAHVINPAAQDLTGETSPSLSSHRQAPQEKRRHSSLGYLTPAEFGALPVIEQRQALQGAARQRGWLAPQLKAA